MDKFSALFLSVVLHPLLMPFYGTLLMFYTVDAWFIYGLTGTAKLMISGVILLNTLIVPVLFLFFMLKTGRVSDIQVTRKKERYLPLLVTLIFYVTTYVVLSNLGLSRALLTFLLVGIIALTMSFLVNLFWKISMHMIGISGVFGAFYSLTLQYNLDFNNYFIWLFLACGLLGTARIRLNQHTPAQIFSGVLLGFLCGAIPVGFFMS